MASVSSVSSPIRTFSTTNLDGVDYSLNSKTQPTSPESSGYAQFFYEGKRTKDVAKSSKSKARGNGVKVDKIHFLGTGSAVPVPQCNVSSCIFTLTTGRSIMFDCGEGTQHQCIRSSRAVLSSLSAICITHLHGDHFYGMFGVLTAMNTLNRTETLYIVGPPGIRTSINTVLRHSSCFLTYPRVFIEVPTNKMTDLTEMSNALGVDMQSVPLIHRVPTVGYVLQERPTISKIDAAKVLSLGGTHHDIKALREGGTFVTNEGMSTNLSDYLLPSQPGHKFSFLQDTRDCSRARPYIDDSFVMIHEATHDATQHALAYKSYHSTTYGAAETAVGANAKNLILTHFSTRYAREPMEVVHAPTASEPFRLVAKFLEPHNADLTAQIVDHVTGPPRRTYILCNSKLFITLRIMLRYAYILFAFAHISILFVTIPVFSCFITCSCFVQKLWRKYASNRSRYEISSLVFCLG